MPMAYRGTALESRGRRFDLELRDAAITDGTDGQWAWACLVRRHGPHVETAARWALVARGRPPFPQILEEILQSVWVRAALRGGRTLRAWDPGHEGLERFLGRLAIWEATDWCRRSVKRREVPLEESDFRKLVEKSEAQISPEQAAQLREALAARNSWESELVPLDKEVLRMHEEGASTRTIGQKIRKHHSTVEAIVHRLERELATLMDGRLR